MKKESYSKKLTLIYLQRLFLERTDETHYIRMPEILSYLEENEIFVDRRTIYTDLDLLARAGFMVEGVKERGGYKYHLPKRTFDGNELKVLIDSVATSKFLTEKKSRDLISKIKSLGSSFDNEKMNRNIWLNRRIKSMNDKVLKNLDTINSAININSQIKFHYMKWTPKKELTFVRKGEEYLVSPFAVTLTDDNYYLIAYDHKYKNLRHYRVDKMKSIKANYEPREGESDFKSFNIVEYSKKVFGMFSGKEEYVKLRCKNHLAGVFIDRFGKDVYMRPDTENPNSFIVTFDVNISPQFYAWLFGLGTSAEILSPDSVKQDFAEMTKSILSLYS